MNRIFTIGAGFPVPDGTIVHSILDTAALHHSAAVWLEQLSVALGVIPPRITSKIHLHPIVTQLTWVIAGELTVMMKDPDSDAPYSLGLTAEQAVITPPGTLFQLRNTRDVPCRVLYVVSPAFLFEIDAGGNVAYNDAIVLDAEWSELEATGWMLPEGIDLDNVLAEREKSRHRMRVRSARTSNP